MKNLTILSWKKSRHECGIRFNLINHVQVFAYDYGISFTINEKLVEPQIIIVKYSDEIDYKSEERKVIGEDKSHAEQVVIIGSAYAIREIQASTGYSSVGRNIYENSNEQLIEAIEELSREITNLKFSIDELKKED